MQRMAERFLHGKYGTYLGASDENQRRSALRTKERVFIETKQGGTAGASWSLWGYGMTLFYLSKANKDVSIKQPVLDSYIKS